MRVLVGCEESGEVRRAFRALGHDAWSCDLLPAMDESPYHLQCDVREVLDRGWDLAIFHPSCQYLANSGARWLYEAGSRRRIEDRWEAMEDAADFFMACWNASVEKVAVENPIIHGPGRQALRDRGLDVDPQIIQPYWFGVKQSKATCLWTRGLPRLIPTNNVGPMPRRDEDFEEWKAWQRVAMMSRSPERARRRGHTLPEVAAAWAEQWGGKARGVRGLVTRLRG